ncbi:unnamed protein product, partial [Nippostrongylus brasiliensis]|uniref:Adducin-related protein 2 (inferred by orthology to a C. elegans protein) n=1 Tax=Nippostrongylus brasiliensis TaxID=27835 RepID=A0A0N4YXB8_NIPBR
MFPVGVQNGVSVPNFCKPQRRPIADLPRGLHSPEEARLRCQLASLYRLVDLFHWSQGIYNHITVRIPVDGRDEILINPFGLLYHEQSASTLVKVDLDGKAGYTLHSAIHAARPDLRCVVHLHVPSVAAVSAMKC